MVKVDFQETLNEILDAKSDKNTRLLLQILDRKNIVKHQDFMLEFQRAINMKKDATNQEKMSLATKEDKEKAKDEDILITDMVRENNLQKSEDIDKDSKQEEAQEISEEELEQKYTEDLTLTQKKYAYIYEKAMKEYYRLKLNIEKQNLREGDLSYDDRNFQKLMRLKDVAVKSEYFFRNSTKGKYIGETVDEIGDLEKKSELEIAKYQKENNRMHESANENIDSIKNQIKECLENIERLSSSTGNLQLPKDTLAKIEDEQERYLSLNQKLECMVPNTVELAIEESRSQEQGRLENREFGYVDKKKVRYSSNVEAKDINYIRKQEAQEQKSDENGARNSLNNVASSVEVSRKKMFEQIDLAIKNKDFTVAINLLDTYQSMYGNDIIEDDKSVKNDIEELSSKLSSQMKKSKEDEKNKRQDQYVVTQKVEYTLDLSTPEGEFKNSLRNQVYNEDEVASQTAAGKLSELENIVEGKSNNSRYEVEIKK